MSYQLQIIEKPTYLHAIVTGSNTVENVFGYLRDLQRECEARQRFNVLIEENLTGRRLETWDVYQIASEIQYAGARPVQVHRLRRRQRRR